MSKPLKDKDGNIVLCGCDNGKCGHVATINIEESGFTGYFVPLCDYHYRLYMDSKNYAYQFDSSGRGFFTTLAH